MSDVSVVIVSFNTKKLTLDCIGSIQKSSILRIELVVVDNGSDDGTVASLKKLANKGVIKLIANKSNLGFAKANNQGIKEARGEYVLLLNSDTVVKKNAIDKLVEFAKSKTDAGVIVPKLLNIDGSLQGSVFRLPTLSRAIAQYWFSKKKLLDKYSPKTNVPIIVESAVMAAFLISPQALKKVGFLDERYFMYYEDHDYCRRLLSSGLRVYFIPSAEVVHVHGASGQGMADEENQWRRLIPSSKLYHGIIMHSLITFVISSRRQMNKFFK